MSDHLHFWAPWFFGYACIGLIFSAWRAHEEISIVDRYGVAKEHLVFTAGYGRTAQRRLRWYKVLRVLEAGFCEEVSGSGILILLFPTLTLNACIGIVLYSVLLGAVHGWFGALVISKVKLAKDTNVPTPDIWERLAHVPMPMIIAAILGFLAVGLQSLLIPITLHVAWDVFCLMLIERDSMKATT